MVLPRRIKPRNPKAIFFFKRQKSFRRKRLFEHKKGTPDLTQSVGVPSKGVHNLKKFPFSFDCFFFFLSSFLLPVIICFCSFRFSFNVWLKTHDQVVAKPQWLASFLEQQIIHKIFVLEPNRPKLLDLAHISSPNFSEPHHPPIQLRM